MDDIASNSSTGKSAVHLQGKQKVAQFGGTVGQYGAVRALGRVGNGGQVKELTVHTGMPEKDKRTGRFKAHMTSSPNMECCA